MSEELQNLIDAYFDGEATPEMLETLDRALRENEQFRVRFLESANLMAELPLVLCEEEAVPLPMPPRSEDRSFNWRPLAMVATVLLGLGAFIFTLLSPSEKANPSSLVLVEGWAHFGEKKLRIGDRCEPPGRIVAGTDAAVVLRYPDGSLLTLEEGSALRLDVGPGKAVFLEHGSLLADMQPQPEGKEMIMDTSNSTVTVLGTRYRLATTILEDLLEVEHGKVRVLEKKTNTELVATRGSSSRVPGVNASLFPTFPADSVTPDGPSPPIRRYIPHRSWFTEDFDLNWTRGLWELSTKEVPEYHPLVKPEPEAFLEKSYNMRGYPTNVLNFSRPDSNGPPVRLRLSEKVGWDHFFLKYYFRLDGDKPFELNPLCLDLPEGTGVETIFEEGGPDPLRPLEIYNRVILEYLRFWNGEKWQVEVRRHVNNEHRLTVRLDIERTPEILFEVTSGGCLFDFISVGQLTPSKVPFRDPFQKWLCTEDFEPRYIETNWDVRPHDEDRLYPITTPGKGAILQRAIGIKGEPTNVLSLSHPSREGSPSQLRLRRRVRWDNFVLQYYYRPTSEEPLQLDPLCLELPGSTMRKIIYENDTPEFPRDSETWNKVRLEYRRIQENGNKFFDVKRIVNNEHSSTTRIEIEETPAILLHVTSGAGIFDWVDVRRLLPEPDHKE